MKAFMTYYWDVLRNNYVKFSGRATRKMYWLFVLFNFIVFFVLSLILSFFGDIGNILYFLLTLAVLLPSLGILVRRLHDTNRSGWWVLISLVPFIGTLVLLVFLVLPSTEGENRFGN